MYLYVVVVCVYLVFHFVFSYLMSMVLLESNHILVQHFLSRSNTMPFYSPSSKPLFYDFSFFFFHTL